MKVTVFNIGKILSGDINSPMIAGDTVVMREGAIHAIGSGGDVGDCDVAIDAAGMTAMPGLIDSHVHITFGDYTPRQRTGGFLESYVQGGVTTCISASEVHVPGRPRDPAGVKAVAIAARKSFAAYRPGGMRVHAGSVILEPGLSEADFAEMQKEGVWLAKAGFGDFPTPYEYAPYVALARKHGIDGAYRRLVHPRLDGHLGRSLDQNAAGRVLSRQWRPDCDARRGLPASGQRDENRDAGVHCRQSAHGASGRQAARRVPGAGTPAHRHGYPHRQRDHAARHALHDESLGFPRRHRA